MKLEAAAFFPVLFLVTISIGKTEGTLDIQTSTPLGLVSKVAPDLLSHIVLTSINVTGPENCIAIFSNGGSAVEVNTLEFPNAEALIFPEDGIVLSTGNPTFLPDNNSGNQTSCIDSKGDDFLDNMLSYAAGSPVTTKDACVLEFEFNAPMNAEGLQFEYVFGSDEYLEWVNSTFNDAFALVLNGANIALVPGLDSYVGLHTVNNHINSDYFVFNDPGTSEINGPVPYPNFEPDGFTTNLKASGAVKPGEVNTISFRIADTSDCNLDSWVLINGGSMVFGPPPGPLPPRPGPPSPPQPPVPGPPGPFGDPHIKPFAGETYDFHGVCDLVLLHNARFMNGLGMDIHIRTAKMRMWSYTSSLAVCIGEEIFEVMGGAGIQQIWMNGIQLENKFIENENTKGSLVSNLSGFPIYFTKASTNQREFVIDLGESEKIVIRLWKLFVSARLENVKDEHFENSLGLLGSFPDGMRLSRDNSTILEDHNAFGQEWQVDDSDPKLFHSLEGPQYPQKCDIPSSIEMRRRLAETSLTAEEAKRACVNTDKIYMDLCIFDVLATDDTSMAGAY